MKAASGPPTATALPRRAAIGRGLPGPVRVAEGFARAYRHVWRGSFVSTFLNPVLYLLALGVGLGTLVDRAGTAPDGIPYAAFVGTGLLAATAMHTAAGDSSWPVMAGIRWTKTYEAALATPVSAADLYLGHLLWVGVRQVLGGLAFLFVLFLFGIAGTPAALLALLPALLTGLAHSAPIAALSARLERETGLSTMFRFGILPMYLFSGTFFPLDQLPAALRGLAGVIPLWHGVQLTRAVVLGSATAWHPAAHLAVLAAWVAAGTYLGLRAFRWRLVR